MVVNKKSGDLWFVNMFRFCHFNNPKSKRFKCDFRKRGAKLGLWRKKHYVITSNFLYAFKNNKKLDSPDRVIFIQVCII